MAGKGSEPRRSVTSKVVAIIRSFGYGRSLTITEVAHVANLPLSTTHRLVHELAAAVIRAFAMRDFTRPTHLDRWN